MLAFTRVVLRSKPDDLLHAKFVLNLLSFSPNLILDSFGGRGLDLTTPSGAQGATPGSGFRGVLLVVFRSLRVVIRMEPRSCKQN